MFQQNDVAFVYKVSINTVIQPSDQGQNINATISKPRVKIVQII